MITFLFYLPFLLGFVVIGVWGERKIASFIQDRYGPMEVGYKGLLQTIADLLKMLQKEDLVPAAADKLLFLAAPIVIFAAVFTGFAVLPLSPEIKGSGIETGVFFLLAVVSLDVVGMLMAGWGSNNKYSLYGALRSVAQIVSYEIPLGITVLCMAVIAGDLDLTQFSLQQGIFTEETNYLFGIKAMGVDITAVGGVLSWNIVRVPFSVLIFLVFFIASLAEANRAPFDLPESESELIGGYHTEYAGFRWGIFMLSEYAMMLLVSLLAVILFFGGWNTFFPNIGSFTLASWTSGTPGELSGAIWGGFWLISKTMGLIILQMQIRWTYPRLRVDQLMSLSWKYLTPAALILLILSGFWKLLMI